MTYRRDESTSVASIVQATLHPDEFKPFRQLPRSELHMAVTRYGRGVDHLQGEWVVAFHDHCSRHDDADTDTYLRSAKHMHQWVNGYELITDRRLLGMSDGTPFEVEYSLMTGVRLNSGFLSDELEISTSAGRVVLQSSARQFERFLSAVLRTPKGTLVAGAPPAVAPSDGDPVGVSAALSRLVSSDNRPRTILSAVHAAFAQGRLAQDTALAFCRRTVLCDRTLACGWGTNGGMWLSPIGAGDLVHAVTRHLRSAASRSDSGTAAQFDFDYRSGGVSGALADLLTPGPEVGTEETVRGVRLLVSEVPDTTWFQLQTFDGARWIPLNWQAPKLLADVLDSVGARVPQVLLARVALGFELSSEQLDASSS